MRFEAQASAAQLSQDMAGRVEAGGARGIRVERGWVGVDRKSAEQVTEPTVTRKGTAKALVRSVTGV